MKPLNQSQIKTAYLKFLGMLLITLVIIISSILFGMKVPFKQNEELQNKITKLQNQNSFTEIFSTKMIETKSVLDTVNKSGVQAELLDQKITDGIKALGSLIDRDSSNNKRFFAIIIQNFADLQFAKKQLRDASSSNQNLSSYMQQIEGLKNDLAREKSTSDGLRASIITLSQGK